jgi:formyltetrahydrofolate deformylase
MDEDFLRISKMFDATRSVVRVPKLDPKFKIAVIASKQVLFVVIFFFQWVCFKPSVLI